MFPGPDANAVPRSIQLLSKTVTTFCSTPLLQEIFWLPKKVNCFL